MELFHASAYFKNRADLQVSSLRSMTPSYDYNQPMKKHNGNPIEATLQSVYRSNLYSEGKTKDYYIRIYDMQEKVMVGNKVTEEEDPKKVSGAPDLFLMDYLMNKKIEAMGRETLKQRMMEEYYKSIKTDVKELAKGRATYEMIGDSSLQARDCLRVWMRATGFKGKTLGDLISHHNEIRLNNGKMKGECRTIEWSDKHKRKVQTKKPFILECSEYVRRGYKLLAFLKSEERTKNEPRAIFSASIIWRAYVYILEKVFATVNSQDASSTILMGSERKITFVQSSQQQLQNLTQAPAAVSLTGDNSKFNETQSPESCILFILKMDLPKEMTEVLVFALHQFTQKRVACMRGIRRETTDSSVMVNQAELLEVLHVMSGEVKERIQAVTIDVDGSFICPRGMLMGMANYAFTTMATMASSFCFTEGTVLTHQSSDDFVTFAAGRDVQHALGRLEMALKASKIAGLNCSEKKSYFCQGLTWEFTSLFINKGKHIPNLGNIEYSTTPQGLGPATDLFNIGKIANNARLRGNSSMTCSRVICDIGLSKVEKLYLTNRKYQDLCGMLERAFKEEVYLIPFTLGGKRMPMPDETMQGFENICYVDAMNGDKLKAAEWIYDNSNIAREDLGDYSWEEGRGELVLLRVDENELKRKKVKPKRKEDRERVKMVQSWVKFYETLVDAHPHLLLSHTNESLTMRDLKVRKLMDKKFNPIN
ncbi:putative basic polymerase 1 [Pilchard orthomyxovirus]|uniref:RNA-directed RNA polymerase catalytic subunit n=16 Tax=Pilchard orthomyxovirus TaxID=2732827 RepID=A0A6M4AJT6_9ORTO|nr:putative basic polymerase 1 [Pilchard orthomyxovirus]QJQ28580.1 putative basic polymerase 1 [Pilchard orthomyxovirus]QJQ28590.1 putative basic polymerase 1 [Pilchard orthomyxovirus]QJQ28600.1 putative basic polymerase 1 [Pilchard orthomyxovirus]QJQ28610.1 putative basic polymerase 1 [Pilchard orthomyxovirus]QJQ28620.1 putative basic polymerase 1 [Pilchard orthomyxovirus]